ncbi:RNA-binding domain-containing protein, partial [Amniculicola lignicola CBS 123094]
IIVENLTKNVKVAHLEEIFGRYGPVKDVSMPLNQTYGTSRGTAYIMFEEPEHADNALVHMHEGQLDGAVLSVSV